jgi:hypothetical protein
LASSRVFAVLLEVLNSPIDFDVASSAMKIAKILSRNKENSDILGKLNICEAIVQSLKSTSVSVLEQTTSTFSNLTATSKYCKERMVELGAYDILVKLIYSNINDQIIVIACCKSLARVGAYKGTLQRLAKSGLIDALNLVKEVFIVFLKQLIIVL